MSRHTLAILKPDCVRNNQQGAVIAEIQKAGFKIIAMKQTRLTKAQAEGFYEVHRQRPFFGELTEFMSSGPCVPMVLEKDNAVAAFRTTIGATDPKEAAEGTIRKLFASSKAENVIHGSDSDDNAKNEIAYFFAHSELIAIR
ncbi:nucleoside-diphosphate kinase [bacterium]|nr:nucleoside-diphosphate kinase [bacterium]NUN44290.1 nucleoside-diphosphate kinase [bacterium]HNE83264.1 nucleoside-diphosphate kinase [bacterium]